MRQYLVILVIVLLLILFLLKVNKNNDIGIKESFDTLDVVAGKAELTPKQVIDASERTV